MSGQLSAGLIAIVLGALLGVLLFVPFVAIQYRKHGRMGIGKLVLWGGFLVYLLALWTYTLLPIPDPDAIRCVPAQLRSFQFLTDIRDNATGAGLRALATNPAVLQVALNVLLFVPLGFFVRLIWRRGFVIATLSGFVMSLLIELTQLTGIYGLYPCAYRLFDVDDLIANTAGAFLGGLASWIVAWWLARRSQPVPKATDVTLRRRFFGALCDWIAASLIGVVASIAVRAWQLYVQDIPAAELTSEVVASWLAPLLITAIISLATGRTIGDYAVLIKWDGGFGPRLLTAMLRYLGGVGGYLILVGVYPPAANLFIVVALGFLVVARRRGGLPGLLSGTRPAIDHPTIEDQG